MIRPKTLRTYPCFKWATKDSLRTISMVSEEISFKAGEELFRKGEPAEFLYILTEGEVEIQFPSKTDERRTVDKLGKGDLLLWSAVIDPYVTTAFGVAQTDGKAVAVDSARLRQLLKEDGDLYHSVMNEVIKIVASRLTGARRQLAQLG